MFHFAFYAIFFTHFYSLLEKQQIVYGKLWETSIKWVAIVVFFFAAYH